MTENGKGGGEFSALFCGVGGQGLVMMSNIVGTACAMSGQRIITGEQHGLSQRSGSVSIHLRVGPQVRSPLIPAGSGDALVALEALESLRYIEYLKDGGLIIANSRIMHPVSETGGMIKDKEMKYASIPWLTERLRKVTANIFFMDALSIARDAGNPLAENIVLLGALSVIEAFPVAPDVLRSAIGRVVPPKALDVNLRAFESGAKAARERFCSTVPCRKADV